MPIKSKTPKPAKFTLAASQPPPPQPTPSAALHPQLAAASTQDLLYFYNMAAALYRDAAGDGHDPNQTEQALPPAYDAGGSSVLPRAPATLVLRLFRQTATHILPVSERFHLGPADRQPLYSLTAQPSPRSAAEFNELAIARRHPLSGAWQGVCTSDVEPRLNLGLPGNWKVASLTIDAMPVWKRMASGRVLEHGGGGAANKMGLWWDGNGPAGVVGGVYGLWWEGGPAAGRAEVFYLVERWRGFDGGFSAGVVRIKAACHDDIADGQPARIRFANQDLGTLNFFGDGRTPPQFVCSDSRTLVMLDLVMAGLMTVLVAETRKKRVI
ncbi:hypothetical protein QBC34DRAFT_426160 [Podospora aff. communis PSN243]|uniref:Uncharacterized protein n=2 Tax=Sordariales TaxID=5139 RepID=A0AA39WDR6_9PEZI|nr:hypothetical protein B0T14DRAFT_498985 [Immersiella caudata]KAK4448721.1 hypothetical protein QBC34DRAFT_426160 [Podospora aff. communis PSN243]